VSADVTFKALFALVIYAGLPGLFKSLLAMVSLLAGVSGDSFTFSKSGGKQSGLFRRSTNQSVLYAFASSFRHIRSVDDGIGKRSASSASQK